MLKQTDIPRLNPWLLRPEGQNYKIYLLVLMVLTTWGCSFFNPYDTEFKCPYTYQGKCVSLSTAYEESLTEADYEIECTGEGRDRECVKVLKKDPAGADIGSAESYYTERKYEELSKLIDEEDPPILTPTEVIRILILPYNAGSGMFSQRYTYTIVKNPTFQLPTVVD